MGGGAWTARSWDTYTRSTGLDKTTSATGSSGVYRSTRMPVGLDPKQVTFRESCASEEHPDPTSIILGLDVTGSMGTLAMEIAKNGLNTLITEIYKKKPVSDPQIMFAAIGDAEYDHAPLQVTQFESDIRIAEQLVSAYFEGGGGGNGGESYILAWYFAAFHTKLDSIDKKNKKGFIFTIGDEAPLMTLTKEQIKEFIGDDVERDYTAEELLTIVSRSYEVYHVIVDPVVYQRPAEKWESLLGPDHTIVLQDYKKLPEVIVSQLQLLAGKSMDIVLNGWDGTTAAIVASSLNGVSVSTSNSDGLVEF